MCTVSPEIVDPDWEIELETITAMKVGREPAGGGVLLPGSVDQVVPQAAAGGVSSKPLKEAGAEPPLRLFSFAHCAPQKVTAVPTAEFPSPITKLPLAKVAKTVTWHEVAAVEPPSSLIVVVIV